MRIAGLILVLAGCGPSLDGVAVSPVPLEPPAITDADLRCDVEAGRWTLLLATDAWAGRVITAWSADGVYVESHRGFSVAAEPDGSGDSLRLDLQIVSDWRAAQPDQATAFTCARGPQVVAWVTDTQNRPSDCWGWGEDPELWREVEGVAPCPQTEPWP